MYFQNRIWILKKALLSVVALAMPAPSNTAFAADTMIAPGTDTGGINIQSFNVSEWKDMLKAQVEFDADIKYFESRTDVDYASSEANVLSDAAKEASEAAKAAILAGDIVVPATREAYNEKYGGTKAWTLK